MSYTGGSYAERAQAEKRKINRILSVSKNCHLFYFFLLNYCNIHDLLIFSYLQHSSFFPHKGQRTVQYISTKPFEKNS